MEHLVVWPGREQHNFKIYCVIRTYRSKLGTLLLVIDDGMGGEVRTDGNGAARIHTEVELAALILQGWRVVRSPTRGAPTTRRGVNRPPSGST